MMIQQQREEIVAREQLIRILLQACKVALLEFERIGFQKKADEKVLNYLKVAISLVDKRDQ